MLEGVVVKETHDVFEVKGRISAGRSGGVVVGCHDCALYSERKCEVVVVAGQEAFKEKWGGCERLIWFVRGCCRLILDHCPVMMTYRHAIYGHRPHAPTLRSDRSQLCSKC